MEIINLKIDELTPYEKNAKMHPDKQVDQIVESIKRFGMNDPIGVWGPKNIIVEGHGRYMALKKMGASEAPCIRLDQMSDAERREYTLIHNKTTMNSDFDVGVLDIELADIAEIDKGIDMAAFGFEIADAEVEDDDYDEPLPDDPKSCPGDVYRLGDHVLMCGDSTSAEDVRTLMGGDLADMVDTDPPYNIAIEGRTDEHLTIANDDMNESDFQQFLALAFGNLAEFLKPGGAFYVWHAPKTAKDFEDALNCSGLEVREQLIWVKNSLIIGRQDYQWRHEPCFYGWKAGGAHYFVDDRTQTTVLEEKKPARNGIHPTMKPIPLIARQIANSSRKGQIVLDLFGGSGTALMACEELGRKARIMEFDQRYVDAIIDRWEKKTGKKAELVKGGRPA